MSFLILVCIGAFVWLVWLVRRDCISLGLPVAYLYSLLLIHVPGAMAYVFGADLFVNSDLVEIGMRFVDVASICFVAGVWLARSKPLVKPARFEADRLHFSWFCLLGGWLFVYGLTPFYRFPSISAALDKGGGIWMLGVLLGLRTALQRTDVRRVAIWLGALFVYPVLMLLLGGFLSYGSAAIIVVCAALTISIRSYAKAIIGIVVFTFLSFSVFVNYFQHRDNIRQKVWGGAPLEARIDSVTETFSGFEWFNAANSSHLISLDERLNQNYFVGLAARRIQFGIVDYLKGESLWEGLLSLVPRALWPEKPVLAGSPQIVAKMTGLRLSPTTSFGVGNVMEFQINFGFPGVIIGFLVLGWLIGRLDLEAAVVERQGELGRVVLYFLPCVALIDPQGSLVQLFSGSAAALVAAYGWKWVWGHWVSHRVKLRNAQFGPSFRLDFRSSK
jgi:hypothetical protein